MRNLESAPLSGYKKVESITRGVVMSGLAVLVGYEMFRNNDSSSSNSNATLSVTRESATECSDIKPYYVPEDSLMVENMQNLQQSTPLSNQGEIYGPPVPSTLTNFEEIISTPVDC